jgi:hypothetical protein
MMKSMHEQVMQTMLRVIDDMADAVMISPTTVAFAVVDFYGRTGQENHLVYASTEHFKQIARGVLSGRFGVSGLARKLADAQDDAFAELLQDRYPIKKSADGIPQYKKRQFMSDSEILWIVARMRKAGSGILRHCDALQAYLDSRGQSGIAA